MAYPNSRPSAEATVQARPMPRLAGQGDAPVASPARALQGSIAPAIAAEPVIAKFPRPVRVVLLLGVPMLMWDMILRGIGVL